MDFSSSGSFDPAKSRSLACADKLRAQTRRPPRARDDNGAFVPILVS
jgi:hypothetical protein